MQSTIRILIITLLVIGISGCAYKKRHQDDPLEPLNRGIFAVNKGLDNLYIKPVLYTYRMVIPPPLRDNVGNFFQNLGEIPTFANGLLQAKFDTAGTAIVRFVFNSTLGVFGLFDVASEMGIERKKETLADTFLAWGYKRSSYIVLPILGPSTIRDSAGFYGNSYLGLTRYADVKTRNRLFVTEYIQTRAELLELEEVVKSAAAVDEYAFVRDAYFQNKENKGKTQEEINAENEEFLDEPPE